MCLMTFYLFLGILSVFLPNCAASFSVLSFLSVHCSLGFLVLLYTCAQTKTSGKEKNMQRLQALKRLLRADIKAPRLQRKHFTDELDPVPHQSLINKANKQ